jgi:uncharacterized ferritin-like protein (DUF455 family)
MTELRRLALAILQTTDPKAKCMELRDLAAQKAEFTIDNGALLTPSVTLPGRPAKPNLVHPNRLSERSFASPEGRAAMLHAISHIEFNAINLALDAVWRFADMPQEYYLDWLQVASEEAYHFGLVEEHLHSLGFRYGDFEAHDGLWQMCEKTRHDVLARMALVPRVMEARGLDVTPAIRAKFAQARDARACEILDIILRDEIGHVLVGNRWYAYCCAQSGLEPQSTFKRLLKEYRAPRIRAPLNMDARIAGGFEVAELESLLS